MSGAADSSAPRLEPIAWIALVARWVELARASRAASGAGAGADPRLGASIAPLIAIESNAAALGELASIAEEERPFARDLAEVSIRRSAAELDRIWRGEAMPEELLDACAAAERALRAAVYAGLEALVVEGAAAAIVPDLALGFDPGDPATHRGTLAAMPPGSIAMPGEPICWWCGRTPPGRTDGFARRGLRTPLQVYRGLDESGRFREDVLAPITEDVLPGLPMLVPLLLDGVPIGRFLQPADEWLALQRRALAGRASIPVSDAASDSDEWPRPEAR